MPARDRHGRGPRGPLLPARLPGSRTRSDRFADVVTAAVRRLEPRWRPHLAAVEVEILELAADQQDPSLATHRPAAAGRPAVVVVHRRPVELRAPDHATLVDLVRDLVAEELAALIGTAPEQLDPGYDAG